MQKVMLVKVIAALLGAAVVVGGIALAVTLSHGTDSYRSILVYELEGTADIEREGTGTISAAENLYLESGDRVTVASDSSMRLKLDDDKYIMVEENSVLSVEATGSKEDSETSIYLERGAITNEIQNRLSDESLYEVTTPNSVMAVRGTTFRVEVYFDENGEVYTKLSTFEGIVVSRLILPDGTLGDEVPVEDGNEVIIHSNENITEYLLGPAEISYEDLPLQTLYVLKDLMQSGMELTGITSKELQELIETKEGVLASDDTEAAVEDTEELEEPEETEEPEQTDNADSSAGASGQEQTGEIRQETDGGGKQTETQQTPADKTQKPADAPQTPADTTQKPGDTPQTPPDTPQESDQTYTVTFMYQGQVFGAQTVKSGQKAAAPKLKPAADGAWDFDFSQSIDKDTTIEWRQ